jgi:hypothetical protein
MIARLGFRVLVVEVASLFAEPLNFGFSLLASGVNQPANPGDVLILARWFYIDDETLLIGCANDPPIRESQIRKDEEESAYQYRPEYMKGLPQPPILL